MSVLVVYASKHGATRGSPGASPRACERLAARPKCPVQDAGDLAVYDAFVIGSAAYEFHWRKEATEFVRRNQKVLAAGPVWLFSSGPLGTDPPTPGPGPAHRYSAERDSRVHRGTAPSRSPRFFGALDPAKLTFAERSASQTPGRPRGSSRRRLPRLAGDRSLGSGIACAGNRGLSAAHPDTGRRSDLALLRRMHATRQNSEFSTWRRGLKIQPGRLSGGL